MVPQVGLLYVIVAFPGVTFQALLENNLETKIWYMKSQQKALLKLKNILKKHFFIIYKKQ